MAFPSAEIDLDDLFELSAPSCEAVLPRRPTTSRVTARPPRSLLAQALVQGLRSCRRPNPVAPWHDQAVEVIVAQLHADAKPVETAESRSPPRASLWPTTGKLTRPSRRSVAGVVTVEETNSFDTTPETTEGMRFDKGLPGRLICDRPGAEG